MFELQPHTTFSHGKGSIEDNVLVAIARGLTKIGIADHGPGHRGYGVKRADIPKMRAEVDRLNRIYGDKIEILLGMEANVMGYDGEIDVTEEEKKYLDYILVGFHYGIVPVSFKGFWNFMIVNNLAKVIPALQKTAIRRNTDAFIRIMEKHDVYALTHPSAKAKTDPTRLGAAAAKHGVLLESNEKHDSLSAEEIALAAQAGAQFLVSSDAHKPGDVGHFPHALDRLKKAGQIPQNVEPSEL